MKRLFVILGFITAIFAVVLSVLPLYKIAFIPAITALVFGVIALYLSRQKGYPKKTIQLIFLLSIISLTITAYKTVFTVVEVGNVEDLKQKEKESEEKALEELNDLEIEEQDLELDDIPEME